MALIIQYCIKTLRGGVRNLALGVTRVQTQHTTVGQSMLARTKRGSLRRRGNLPPSYKQFLWVWGLFTLRVSRGNPTSLVYQKEIHDHVLVFNKTKKIILFLRSF